MTDGLKKKHRQAVIEILTANRRVDGVVLFGSRAMGTHTIQSDVDLALLGDQLTLDDESSLAKQLEQLSMPQEVDLLRYENLQSEKLREHIQECGKEWYRRDGSRPICKGWIMPIEWMDTTVNEIADPSPNALVTGPFGSKISSRFFQTSGVPVIRESNLSADVTHRLIEENLAFLSAEKANEFVRNTAFSGDLVFTCWGTIGQVGLIDERASYCQYVISNKQMKLKPDPSIANSLFLYYLFSGPEMLGTIQGQAIGSSVPGFNLGQLGSLRLRLPSLTEQQTIANILGTLDDKIELNRRMNGVLESMARAIFKAWFIDFEPVRAKAAGATSFRSMPQSVFDGLPDRFVDSELGEMPEGWEVVPLDSVCDFNYGKALKAVNRRAGNVPVYGSNGRVGWHDEALVNGNGIVVGRKGNPGTVVWVHSHFFPIDTTFYVSSKREEVTLPYLRYALDYLRLDSYGSDSAVPGLSRKMAYGLPLIIANGVTISAFEVIFNLLQTFICNCKRESSALANIRDALLPKLISGELRVSGGKN